VVVIDESKSATDRPWTDPVEESPSAAGDRAPAPTPPETDAAPPAAAVAGDDMYTPVLDKSNDLDSASDAANDAAGPDDIGPGDDVDHSDEVNGAAGGSDEPPAESGGDGDESGERPGQNKDWYILKVQSNREESIRDGLLRRVKIHGLDDYFGEVIVPTELVTEFKNGKKKVSKRKLYPGYLMVNMEINEETWFLVRETPGIGDFTGSAGKPSPMLPHEVSKILAKQEEKTDESPKLKIAFNVGDRVKINEGTFANFEGDVDSIDEANGRVTVMINIFGRSTPVELEYWQVESID
jgi:transcriptional antiterminator NusG